MILTSAKVEIDTSLKRATGEKSVAADCLIACLVHFLQRMQCSYESEFNSVVYLVLFN